MAVIVEALWFGAADAIWAGFFVSLVCHIENLSCLSPQRIFKKFLCNFWGINLKSLYAKIQPSSFEIEAEMGVFKLGKIVYHVGHGGFSKNAPLLNLISIIARINVQLFINLINKSIFCYKNHLSWENRFRNCDSTLSIKHYHTCVCCSTLISLHVFSPFCSRDLRIWQKIDCTFTGSTQLALTS